MKKEVDAVIIGAGLTGLTAGFYLAKAGKRVAIIEKNDRPGGVIRTLHEQGFTIESGPNTGVFSSPDLVRLFDDLGDGIQPQFANHRGKSRWIWKRGKWHALPAGPVSAVTTPLFRLKDKFRILGEPWRKRGNDPNETLDQLVRRRMGRSFLDYAVDPFISGVYAGDPSRLVTRYALPRLYALEQDYGSFVRGAIAKRKEPKDDLTRRATREVFSVEGGLQRLTDTLAERIGSEQIFTGVSRTVISELEQGFLTAVTREDRRLEIRSDHVITTAGGPELTELLPFIGKEEAGALLRLNYARVIQVSAAYRNWKGIPLDAFGGLIPSREQRDALGILFTSSIFPDRAPEGGAVLSVFMGGMRRPDMMERNDQALASTALKEIRETLGSVEKPELLHIFRYPQAIPQYEASTGERLAAIERVEREHPGLILAGNIRDGIGMSDRVKQGHATAQTILNEKHHVQAPVNLNV
jgi:oxygen-dependent protoporphyrinogen oxidase